MGRRLPATGTAGRLISSGSGFDAGRSGGDRERPLQLLPPRLVPLSAEQERQAVDALSGLLATLLARRRPSSRAVDVAECLDDPGTE